MRVGGKEGSDVVLGDVGYLEQAAIGEYSIGRWGGGVVLGARPARVQPIWKNSPPVCSLGNGRALFSMLLASAHGGGGVKRVESAKSRVPWVVVVFFLLLMFVKILPLVFP